MEQNKIKIPTETFQILTNYLEWLRKLSHRTPVNHTVIYNNIMRSCDPDVETANRIDLTESDLLIMGILLGQLKNVVIDLGPWSKVLNMKTKLPPIKVGFKTHWVLKEPTGDCVEVEDLLSAIETLEQAILLFSSEAE